MAHRPRFLKEPVPGLWDGIDAGRRPGAARGGAPSLQRQAEAWSPPRPDVLPFNAPDDANNPASVRDVARRWWEIDAAAWPLPHFSPYELRCRGADALGGGLVYVTPVLGKFLEYLRAETGGRPMTVSSCYRTREYNDELRRRGYATAPNSRHLRGDAADIVVRGRTVEQMLAAAERFVGPNGERIGGIGLYPNSAAPFIHFDFGPPGRRWGDPFPEGFDGMAEDETGVIGEAEAEDQAKARRATGGIVAGGMGAGGLAGAEVAVRSDAISPSLLLQLAPYGAVTALTLGLGFAAFVYRRELSAWLGRAWRRVAGR